MGGKKNAHNNKQFFHGSHIRTGRRPDQDADPRRRVKGKGHSALRARAVKGVENQRADCEEGL